MSVRETKVPVSIKVLSHWWIDFDVGGSTFYSVRTRRCTRVTDLNSVNQRAYCIFVSKSLLMKSVAKVYRLRLPINARMCGPMGLDPKNLGEFSNPLRNSLLHNDG
ncbi:hypothetical protein TNCV_318101 [Trichonephila clavipes]|nr:hypothetical protein TNCV_318101 [Trichonephila clavipes]